MSTATSDLTSLPCPTCGARAVSLQEALLARTSLFWQAVWSEWVQTAELRAAPHMRHLARKYAQSHPALAAEWRRMSEPTPPL